MAFLRGVLPMLVFARVHKGYERLSAGGSHIVTFEKTSIVVATTASMVVITFAAFGAQGVSEEALRIIVRWTARVSVTAFLLAFSARPLRQIWSSELSGWLLRNRRYLGVSFAVAHFTHLVALIGIGMFFPQPFRSELDALTLVGGGFCYVLIALMALTSTDRTAAWVSRKNWRRLHTLGMYTIWIIFVQSYVPRAIIEDMSYAPVSVALFAVAGVRGKAWLNTRSSTAATAS